MGIASYAQINRNIEMNKANYQIGLARNPHSHDVRKYDVNKNEDYHFYVSTLSAFKALLSLQSLPMYLPE